MPQLNPTFVGRQRELEWLEERVFFGGRWATPVVVAGPGGSGKTTLVKQLLASPRSRQRAPWLDSTPLWLDLHLNVGPNAETHVNESIEKLYDETRSTDEARFRELFVVLDGAELLSDRAIEYAVGRLFNLKRVRSVVLTTRRAPKIDRSEVLDLNGLEPIDAERLLRALAQHELSAEAAEQAVRSTHGYPLAVSLLAHLLRDRGPGALSQILAGQLYDISNAIVAPPGEILTVVAPRIVTAREALAERLRERPEAVHDLSPRNFEELLAELLSDMGWQVELTPATRDGGKDILAYLETDVGKLLCLVEAKKYRRDRKVGVDLVRTLYGTFCDYQANSAMLVTTSSFTPDARDFQKKHEYQLSLKEYGDVVEWIQRYKRRDNAV